MSNMVTASVPSEEGQMYCNFGTYGYGMGSVGSNDHTPAGVAVYGAGAGVNAGKIVVAGSYGDDIVVMRFNTNGTLDNSFSGDGIVTAHVFASEVVTWVGIDSNGSIVVAGRGFDGSTKLVVARFTSAGVLDTTCNGTGTFSQKFLPDGDNCGGDCEYYSALVIQPDNKIVIVGLSGYDDQTTVLRFTTAGALDTSFDGDGKKTFYVGASAGSSLGRAVTIKRPQDSRAGSRCRWVS